MKPSYLLALLVILATLIRAFFIWIDRPEFVGWFNHTYYYYVEVKGLLTQGQLPYADMPLLFYLYAGTAKVIAWFGVSLNDAIVSATRFWMSIIPSLIPLPVYFTLRYSHPTKSLCTQEWLLVCVSAFLPLSLLHLPEFSQKNTLGLLLLAVFFFFTQKALFTSIKKNITLLGLFAALIVLTHFGTAGALFLYVLALSVAFLFIQKNAFQTLKLVGGATFGLGLAICLIYWFDIKRVERIAYYLGNSLNNSFVGILFSSSTSAGAKSMATMAIMLPILMLWIFLKTFHIIRQKISTAHQIFYLSHCLFCYLLVFPLYDQLLLARFSLFSYLSLIIILGYIFHYTVINRWLKLGLQGFIITSVLMMMLGEWMSLKMHNPDKELIFTDLMKVKKQANFNAKDLIITKNGAEHIANWFWETKSGVITSLNTQAFAKYKRVYILNPIEGELNFEGIWGKSATNEKDRYHFMLSNIPAPQNAQILYQSKYLQLLRLKVIPKEWVFDKNGNWKSYGKTGKK